MYKLISNTISDLAQKLGRTPTDEEVAIECNIHLDIIDKYKNNISDFNIVFIDSKENNLLDLIPSNIG